MLVVGLSALAAGYTLMIDPSGSKLGISADLLVHSPFSDFLIPGIMLFILNGVLNILAVVCTVWKIGRFPGMVVLQGVLLLGWIIIQMVIMQEIYILNYLLGGIGLILFMLGNRLNV
jgi:hypothetical protein